MHGSFIRKGSQSISKGQRDIKATSTMSKLLQRVRKELGDAQEGGGGRSHYIITKHKGKKEARGLESAQ